MAPARRSGEKGPAAEPAAAPPLRSGDGRAANAAEERERKAVIAALRQLVEPLAAIVPGETEVVLHDLSLLPNSIVAIWGSLTKRQAGGPATDLLLQAAARNQLTTRVGYLGRGQDGQQLRCSTIIVRTSAGTPVAALCVNCETRLWRSLSAVVAAMAPAAEDSQDSSPERFVGDVDELAEDLLDRAIEAAGIEVGYMKKPHKLAVVATLKASGFFILREAVERAAAALQVSRFTIYNYLKELDAAEAGEEAEASDE
ncbi:MAG: helix-turn-helix transcriptional regulator [Propionibacteriaceae bacterium]|jgi:predicted transcriptional regulator YheO|nr:helix-turn-helix transcriptional regulator [Propionibacteriaceae bacterium]